MSDTETVEPGTTKVVKQPQPCACSRFLLADEAGAGEGEEPALFDTECSATTLRTFAQGHDARLVSFLVHGQFDGLAVRENRGGVVYSYDGAAHAASTISEALGAKAEAAIEQLNKAKAEKDERAAKRASVREAKAAEKATKKAAAAEAKAAKKAATDEAKALKVAVSKVVGAKVVEGSTEGDAVPATDGLVKIKVGRGEYDAVASEVDNGEGGTKTVYTFRNMRGEEETRDADTVRVPTK